ncbi:MAG: hypothetical protein FGM53_03890 [Rhodocyclaceae bacterium]|nr:hypothetical protein [Rhodocyclaceae bacterium]
MHNKKSRSITERARELASFGLNQQMIAAALGVSRSTFYRKLAETPELELAIEEGRALAIAEVARKMMARAKTGDDFQSMAFILRSRGGFDDRSGGLSAIRASELDGNGPQAIGTRLVAPPALRVVFIDPDSR